MRPTGRLHIGHYFGALQNWVRLQNDSAYECFYFIADWHALTSDYADTSGVAENTLQIMIDYLAAGLDPAKSVIACGVAFAAVDGDATGVAGAGADI